MHICGIGSDGKTGEDVGDYVVVGGRVEKGRLVWGSDERALVRRTADGWRRTRVDGEGR